MLEHMREIGRIKQVQVQRTALKVVRKPHKYYDPAPLLVVETLRIGPEGVIGITADGESVIDVHSAQHPDSRFAGVNGISLGFTGHYRAMRKRFGEHLVDGCAGENILVEVDKSFALADLGGQTGRVAIVSQESASVLYLSDLQVAAPCVEFTQYAANESGPLEGKQLQAALQFLDGGQRGFYATLEGNVEGTIRAGDHMLVSG
jgi:hypothetical protein